MCRFMVYKGRRPILMADLLTNPTRSIITQSYASKERIEHNPLNGDGFGVGWYLDKHSDTYIEEKKRTVQRGEDGDPDVPCIFTSVNPAWSNLNLKRIAAKTTSPLIFAHVRAAYPGMPVTETNCHPFQYGRFMWMHNGGIGKYDKISRLARESLSDELFAWVQGTTDSEMTFALFLNQIESPKTAILTPQQLRQKVVETIRVIQDLRAKVGISDELTHLNFAVTDGETVVATKFVDPSEETAASLYFSTGTKFGSTEVCGSGGKVYSYRMSHTEKSPHSVIISSEPLTDNPIDWVPIPKNNLVVITPDLSVLMYPILFDEDFSQEQSFLTNHGPSDAEWNETPTTSRHNSLSLHHSHSFGSPHMGNLMGKSSTSPPGYMSPLATHHGLHMSPHPSSHVTRGNWEKPHDSWNHSSQWEWGHTIDVKRQVVSLAVLINTHTMMGSSGFVLCGLEEGTLALLSLSGLNFVSQISAHAGAIFSVVDVPPENYKSPNSRVLTTSADSTMKLWEISFQDETQSAEIRNLKNFSHLTTGGILSLGVFPKGPTVNDDPLTFVFGSQSTTMMTCDISTETTTQLSGHYGYIYGIVMMPPLFASCSGDGTIKLWEISTLKEVQTLVGHKGGVQCIHYQYPTLYSGSRDGTIKVWEQWERGTIGKWLCIRTLRDHQSPILALSATNTLLFSSSDDHVFKVWDRDRLMCLHSIALTDKCLTILPTTLGIFLACGINLNLWEYSLLPMTTAHSPHPNHFTALSNQTFSPESAMIDTLRKFVEIPSVSSDPVYKSSCWKAARYLFSLLEELGAETKLVPVPNEGRNPVIIARLGKNPNVPTVTIYGHYDVVGVGERVPESHNAWEGWESPPFKLNGRGGYLYGRGVVDDKGPIVCALYAIRQLQKNAQTQNSPNFNLKSETDPRSNLKRSGEDFNLNSQDLGINVCFIFEGEEECDSEGFEEVIQERAEFFAGTEVILIMNTYFVNSRPCLVYGLRGVIELQVEVSLGVESTDLHSGLDGGAVHEPFHEISYLLSQLVDGKGEVRIPGFYDNVRGTTPDERELFAKLDFNLEAYKESTGVEKFKKEDTVELLADRWSRPNLSIVQVETSGRGSVISKSVRGRINVRYVPDQSASHLIDLISDFLRTKFSELKSPNKLQLETLRTGEWWLGDYNNQYYSAAAAAIKSEWGCDPGYAREGGTIPVTPFLERVFNAPAVHLPIGESSDSANFTIKLIYTITLKK
eukprot:TRINITY_DN2859_c0_g1_i1.p1 TRINITY_DN2859_c0_g1~~TRINITY_DN2859_c0_g1_i1.p1  ORF type:complete len:1228 (-),score=417.22 TRINITY_DN2859_c0_g1_i1:56-3739(-)